MEEVSPAVSRLPQRKRRTVLAAQELVAAMMLGAAMKLKPTAEEVSEACGPWSDLSEVANKINAGDREGVLAAMRSLLRADLYGSVATNCRELLAEIVEREARLKAIADNDSLAAVVSRYLDAAKEKAKCT